MGWCKYNMIWIAALIVGIVFRINEFIMFAVILAVFDVIENYKDTETYKLLKSRKKAKGS